MAWPSATHSVALNGAAFLYFQRPPASRKAYPPESVRKPLSYPDIDSIPKPVASGEALHLISFRHLAGCALLQRCDLHVAWPKTGFSLDRHLSEPLETSSSSFNMVHPLWLALKEHVQASAEFPACREPQIFLASCRHLIEKHQEVATPILGSPLHLRLSARGSGAARIFLSKSMG